MYMSGGTTKRRLIHQMLLAYTTGMDFKDIAHQRLHNQYLLDEKLPGVKAVVQHLTAVQSQDYPGAKWGLAQRVSGVTSADVDELYNKGVILRTHVMRPTWHFVLPDDILWMVTLTAPRVNALMGHYNKLLDLDDKLFKRCEDIFSAALTGKNYLTRTELSVALETHGVQAKGQRLAHIVFHAELAGVICSGPLRGKQFTYALLSERAPKARRLEYEEALTEITTRYFTSHGPATIHDFSWWSGLTIAQAKQGMELVRKKLTSIDADGQTYWHATSQTPPPAPKLTLHLLPNYDEFLISYKGYGTIFKANHFPPNAIDSLRAHIIVLNGQVIGGWKRTLTPKQATVTPDLLVKLKPPERQALQAAVQAFGDFLGITATLS